MKRLGILSLIAIFILSSLSPMGHAQVAMMASTPFIPLHLKGIKMYADQPLTFDFVVEPGNSVLLDDEIVEHSQKLVRYFFAALTLPEEDMWVNLSPREEDRIIPEEFGLTEMGQDLLEMDYMLKDTVSSMIHPDGEIGKKFWDGLYEEIYKEFGTTDVPMDVFHKIWIVPHKAKVYEGKTSALILDSTLEVQLEKDYFGLKEQDMTPTERIITAKMRDLVVPRMHEMVNSSKAFANLRQIYASMILATWYKKKVKQSLMKALYVDQKKMQGVDLNKEENIQELFGDYKKLFKDGKFNFIREDYDPGLGELIPRKYFSGGWETRMDPAIITTTDRAAAGAAETFSETIITVNADAAMPSMPGVVDSPLTTGQKPEIEAAARDMANLLQSKPVIMHMKPTQELQRELIASARVSLRDQDDQINKFVGLGVADEKSHRQGFEIGTVPENRYMSLYPGVEYIMGEVREVSTKWASVDMTNFQSRKRGIMAYKLRNLNGGDVALDIFIGSTPQVAHIDTGNNAYVMMSFLVSEDESERIGRILGQREEALLHMFSFFSDETEVRREGIRVETNLLEMIYQTVILPNIETRSMYEPFHLLHPASDHPSFQAMRQDASESAEAILPTPTNLLKDFKLRRKKVGPSKTLPLRRAKDIQWKNGLGRYTMTVDEDLRYLETSKTQVFLKGDFPKDKQAKVSFAYTDLDKEGDLVSTAAFPIDASDQGFNIMSVIQSFKTSAAGIENISFVLVVDFEVTTENTLPPRAESFQIDFYDSAQVSKIPADIMNLARNHVIAVDGARYQASEEQQARNEIAKAIGAGQDYTVEDAIQAARTELYDSAQVSEIPADIMKLARFHVIAVDGARYQASEEQQARNEIAKAIGAGQDYTVEDAIQAARTELYPQGDKAITGVTSDQLGGVDLAASKLDLQLEGDGSDVEFAFDPAMVVQWQERLKGFTPNVISLTRPNQLMSFID